MKSAFETSAAALQTPLRVGLLLAALPLLLLRRCGAGD
jgi:hypothetical protein